MLATCNLCGAHISTKDTHCPHCGGEPVFEAIVSSAPLARPFQTRTRASNFRPRRPRYAIKSEPENQAVLICGILGFFIFPCAIVAVVIGRRGQLGYKLGMIALIIQLVVIAFVCTGYLGLFAMFATAASHGR